MIQAALKHISTLLGAIFIPSFCRSCRLFLYNPATFCVRCSGSINFIDSTSIAVTPHFILPVFAVSHYSYPLKDLIVSKFYADKTGFDALADYMIKHSAFNMLAMDYCIAVPITTKRYKAQGFNQSKILAKALASYASIPYIQPLLIKEYSALQTLFVKDSTAQNAHTKFAFKDFSESLKKLQNKHILIVDDVMLSEHTIKCVAQLLLLCKPASISALVGCRL